VITLAVLEDMKFALRETEWNMMEQAAFDAWDGGRRRQHGCAQASLDGRSHGLVRRQLHGDLQTARIDSELRQSLLEDRPRPRSWFPEDPFAVAKAACREIGTSAPGVVGTDHENELVPRNRRTHELRTLHRAFNEAKLCRPGLDRRGNLGRIADCEPDVGRGWARRNATRCRGSQ
jgi:hypothetical protein